MSWAQSLIKLSTYEVEVLQKRMAEIAERRMAAEMKLAMLEAEGEAEAMRARQDAEAGWYQIGFWEGLRARKAMAKGEGYGPHDDQIVLRLGFGHPLNACGAARTGRCRPAPAGRPLTPERPLRARRW